MNYYGSVKGALECAANEWRNHPGTIIRIHCTCGRSKDFEKYYTAKAFLVLHSTHISTWSIELVDISGVVVWKLRALFVKAKAK